MVAEMRILAAAFPKASDAQAACAGLAGAGGSLSTTLYTDAGHTIRAGLLGGAVWGGVLGALFDLLFPRSVCW
jgi:hypothetical protein